MSTINEHEKEVIATYTYKLYTYVHIHIASSIALYNTTTCFTYRSVQCKTNAIEVVYSSNNYFLRSNCFSIFK